MGILARILRFIVWLIIISWVTWLIRKAFARAAQKQPQPQAPGAEASSRPLFRDPVCGTHVPAEISLTLDDSNQTLHFCSAECRDKYVNATRRAASA